MIHILVYDSGFSVSLFTGLVWKLDGGDEGGYLQAADTSVWEALFSIFLWVDQNYHDFVFQIST